VPGQTGEGAGIDLAAGQPATGLIDQWSTPTLAGRSRSSVGMALGLLDLVKPIVPAWFPLPKRRWLVRTWWPPLKAIECPGCDPGAAGPQLDHLTAEQVQCLLKETGKTTLHRFLIEKPLVVARKAAFIGCIIALGVLSWLPANAFTRTTYGGHAEHLVAYLGAAIIMGFSAQTRLRLTAQCAVLIGYAAFLEAGQVLAQGRHASFQDFAVSSGGVVLGGLLVWIARSGVAIASRHWSGCGFPPYTIEMTNVAKDKAVLFTTVDLTDEEKNAW
jgi:VanZ family protein